MACLEKSASREGIGVDGIVILLQEAAALAVHDLQSSRTRLARVWALLETLETPPSCPGQLIRVLAPWQANRVKSFINDHLDGPIPIEVLADHTRLSMSYFFRAFRGTFGVPPHAYIMQCRTDRAMELLADGDDPLAEIAISCGFSDQAHFSRVFARRAGIPPGAWRRLQRGALSIST